MCIAGLQHPVAACMQATDPCWHDSSPPGLQPLQGLTALRELHLCYCSGLSDSGVRAALAPLTRQSLAHIDVTGCSGLTQARL